MRASAPRRHASMVITIPPPLAAKLRERLAELEMSEAPIYRNVCGFLQCVLEDDELLLDGWTYPDRATAERIAGRIFRRCPELAGTVLTVGSGLQAQAVRFDNPMEAAS